MRPGFHWQPHGNQDGLGSRPSSGFARAPFVRDRESAAREGPRRRHPGSEDARAAREEHRPAAPAREPDAWRARPRGPRSIGRRGAPRKAVCADEPRRCGLHGGRGCARRPARRADGAGEPVSELPPLGVREARPDGSGLVAARSRPRPRPSGRRRVVSVRCVLEVLDLVESRFGDGTYEATRTMLREEAGNFASLRRLLTRALPLPLLLELSPNAYHRDYNHGRLEVDVQDRRAIMKHYDWMSSPARCAAWLGTYEGFLELIGIEGTVTKVACLLKDDPYCGYLISWRAVGERRERNVRW